MQKKFELWLDESGNFMNEAELKKQKKNPSLIGGILLEKEYADSIDLDDFIDNEHNHAMHFTDEQKRTYSLPVLERLKKEYNARQVFFENQTYTDDVSNRQLYLRIMAEGLLQLLQTLNAIWESVEIEVIIAQRQDVEERNAANRRISDEEYIAKLKETINRKRRMRRIQIHGDSELKYSIQPAHKQKKLQMADFACNTRLTRNSKAFSGCRGRVEKLYEDAFIFSLAERGSDNYIRTSLAQGFISDAIMELYASLDTDLNRKELLSLIMDRMQKVNHRILKSQLKQCSADIVAYAALQDDYEVSEALFKQLHTELVAMMHEKGIPCYRFEFTLLLWLSDNYLREGDVIAARNCIKKCREVHESLQNSLEEIFTYYQLLEKESLLAINEFNFKKGKELMHSASNTFKRLMQFFITDDTVNQRFPSLKSEYYGDALCMEIYAGMFLQRENPDMYEELCAISDIAMKQYPDEKGELERHRQYRSRIELEKGNHEEAIRYLIMAKEYEPKPINKASLINFLELVSDTEQNISCQYYLMYYLLILSETKFAGNDKLSDLMFEALIEQKRLLQYGGLHKTENSEMQIIDIQGAKVKKSGVAYHPLEIIAWKYASYLFMCERYDAAERYYTKAISMCYVHSNYATLQITGIGIWSEFIVCLIKNKKAKAAEYEYNKLLRKIEALMKHDLQPETADFIRKMELLLKESNKVKGKMDIQKLIEVSRKITY